MTDGEILLQPDVLAELERYRALEHRVQVSRQLCQEFSELAQQVAPGSTIPLPTPLSDGSPAAEFDAALAALKQQIRTMHKLEAQLNDSQKDVRRPVQRSQPSLPPQPLFPLLGANVRIALYFLGGVVLFVLLLVLLRAVSS